MRQPREAPQRYFFPKVDRWMKQGMSRWPVFSDEDKVIRELHFELTYRCNLKCIMCDLWGQERADPGKAARELSSSEIRRFIDASRCLNDVKVVVLSGGEPLLRSDLPDLVDYFSKRFPRASIGILGNLLNERLVRQRLEEIYKRCSPRLWIGSSLDGIGEKHDRVRGTPGAWEKMIGTVRFLRKEYPSVDLSVTFTLTPLNHKELLSVYDWAEKERIGFGAQYVVQKEGTPVFSWKKQQLDGVSRQIRGIMERLCRQADAAGHIFRGEADKLKWLWARLYYWKTLMQYGYKPRRYIAPCLAGRRYAMVDPWGNVSFCSPHKKKPIGNAREIPFDVLWQNAKANRLREHIDGLHCDCWLMCTANPVIDRILNLAFPPASESRSATCGRGTPSTVEEAGPVVTAP